MEQMSRLARMQCSTEGLEYQLRGGKTSNGKPCLRVSVRGSLQLPCQRCLDPLEVSIAVDVELQLAGSLREIAAADDDIDRLLGARRTDVAELVEDEVLLALPMVPRHEACATHRPITQA